jgi:SPP1 gp7 family putative phage head morphogenesis protein
MQRSDRAFAKMTGDLSADVRRVISDGILQERSQGQILKSIDEIADTYDYAAKRIVRTETMEAVNTGVMDEYRSEGVDKVEWLAAEGCCPRCQELDGRVYSIDGGVHAPLHPNCRCTLIPVVDAPGKSVEVSEWTEES